MTEKCMGLRTGTDSLCFIQDSFGTWYRLNAEGQLVAASGAADAGVFTRAEAEARIGEGKRARYYTIVESAGLQGSAEEAVPVTGSEAVSLSGTAMPEESAASPAEQQDTAPGRALRQEITDLAGVDWLAYLRDFCYIVAYLGDFRQEMERRQTDTDAELQDLLHYAELYDLDDREALRIMDLIKAARERRRDLKDVLLMTECFQRSIGSAANAARAKTAVKQIEKLERRTYRPRILSDLFRSTDQPLSERRILSGAWRLSTGQETTEDAAGRETEEAVMRMAAAGGTEQVQNNQEQTEEREMIRRETIFDGQENDWRAMAEQQMEFFRDGEQYAVNLTLSLRALDAAIEQSLSIMENASYNAVQGYQAFRELKELRMRRTACEKELRAVQTFITCFDMQGMREAYEYCLSAMEQPEGGEDAGMQQDASGPEDSGDPDAEIAAD